MNRKQVIDLAARACVGTRSPGVWEFSTEALELFAEMVTRVEREACAKVCEEVQFYNLMRPQDCADVIRARTKE